MPGAAAADRRLLMEVEKGNLSGVKKLLAGGANIDGSRELEYRPIISAARSGNATMLKLLISNGADLEVPARVPAGTRALHAAIAGEKLDALRVLIDAGAYVDSKDGEGQTPLMQTSLATTNGAAMAQELLNALADPFAKNNNGMTAMHVAAGLGSVHIMRVVLAHTPSTLNKLENSGFTPLGIAALKGEQGAVSYLLDAGASDRGVHPDKAAIFWAAEGGHPDMVRLMLEYPIDSTGGLIAIPNAIGVAIQSHQTRMLDMLISVQGDGNRKKWAECRLRGGYPLNQACAWVCFRSVHVLLSAGASETYVDSSGSSARVDVGRALAVHMRDPEREAALCRMLERGPAFRARSFAWTAEVLAVDGGGGAASASSGLERAAGVLGVSVYRPVGTRFFASRFERYVKK